MQNHSKSAREFPFMPERSSRYEGSLKRYAKLRKNICCIFFHYYIIECFILNFWFMHEDKYYQPDIDWYQKLYPCSITAICDELKHQFKLINQIAPSSSYASSFQCSSNGNSSLKASLFKLSCGQLRVSIEESTSLPRVAAIYYRIVH